MGELMDAASVRRDHYLIARRKLEDEQRMLQQEQMAGIVGNIVENRLRQIKNELAKYQQPVVNVLQAELALQVSAVMEVTSKSSNLGERIGVLQNLDEKHEDLQLRKDNVDRTRNVHEKQIHDIREQLSRI